MTLWDQPSAAEEMVWTVSDLNRTVRQMLEGALPPFWVRGEIGNLTIHRSGHVYFSLKDARSQVSAVFFRGAGEARKLELAVGLEVEAYGRAGLYEPRGQFQIIVSRLRTHGLGDLQQRFEELKRRLREEGLFDEERKRPIPLLPQCVGVVTSPQGAAIRDVLRVLERRCGGLHVRVVPCAVQGRGAARQIAAAVNWLSQAQCCDVVVVTRGGGSLEDLWAFNEEPVARAVAASAVPVISAVGHERDFTICDYAADLRVATPSAAAERVAAARAELTERLGAMSVRLGQRLELQVAALRRRVERAVHHPVFREPAGAVRTQQQRTDELASRLSAALQWRIERVRGRLREARATLAALNPKRVLERGYAIVLDPADGRAVRDACRVAPGDRLRALLARGEIDVDVAAVRAAEPENGHDDG